MCIQPKLTVLYHLGLLKDTGGLPMMKSPNDTALGTHPVITGHRTACWETESEKGDVAFSLWWGTPQHWSCSDVQPERPRERWVWGRQWANCTPNALSSEKWQPSKYLSTCWASLSESSKVELSPSPLGALLRFRHFLCPLWKHTSSHCPQPTVRAFHPCFVQTWGGPSSKPHAGHLHEPSLV